MNREFPEDIRLRAELLKAAKERKISLGWGSELNPEELDAILPPVEFRPSEGDRRPVATGLSHEHNGRWRARYRRGGRFVHVGYFGTAEEARAAIEDHRNGIEHRSARGPNPRLGSGVGCYLTVEGRWQVRIRIAGKLTSVGTFPTAEEAQVARAARLAEIRKTATNGKANRT